jgi:DNA-binding transcriptional regulator YiaG
MPKGICPRKKRTETQKLNNKIAECKRLGKPIDDIERFWSYVNIKDFFDCWEWQGSLNKSGYGIFRKDGKTVLSHRMAYEFYYGEIPEESLICHKCNNRKCNNPFHTYAGTNQDNMADMVKAGRQNKAFGERVATAKLTGKQVIEIRENKDKLTQRELAKVYGVGKSMISYIVLRKNWKHI